MMKLWLIQSIYMVIVSKIINTIILFLGIIGIGIMAVVLFIQNLIRNKNDKKRRKENIL